MNIWFWSNWKWIQLTLLSVYFWQKIWVFDCCFPLHVISALWWFIIVSYARYLLFFLCLLALHNPTSHWSYTCSYIHPFPHSLPLFFHSHTNTSMHTLSLVTRLSSVHSCGCGSFFFFFCPWRHHWRCHPLLRPIIQAERRGHYAG